MHASDDMITAAFTKYCSHPVVVVRINLADNPRQSTADNTTESIIADPHEDLQIDKLPCRGFVALPKIEDTNSRSNFELSNDRSSPHIDSRFSLQYLPISLNPEESEMVGIEQLLRHIKEDSSVSDFQKGMAKSLRVIKNLNENIDVMSKYLKRVSSGELRHNDEIIARIQRIWHRLPDISLMPQIHDSLSSAINDNYLHQYINSLTKASLVLNNLIENTIENRETMQERSVN
ncbi:MAG: 26S proteasome non-ATPase regulatory subunit 7 [Marteilia pararefringens]